MLQFDLSRTRVIDTLSKVESFDALIFVDVIPFPSVLRDRVRYFIAVSYVAK